MGNLCLTKDLEFTKELKCKMITEYFCKAVALREGGVVILAGSDSDQKHIDEIVGGLEKYKLPYEVRIASAHKQPSEVFSLIMEYDALHAPLAYVTVAGGTDALSGMVAFHALHPVISCPPESSNAVNESCLSNPSGSSNAYIAKPANLARFLAQMFSSVNKKCENILEEERRNKIDILRKKDEQLQKQYVQRLVKIT